MHILNNSCIYCLIFAPCFRISNVYDVRWKSKHALISTSIYAELHDVYAFDQFETNSPAFVEKLHKQVSLRVSF